MTPPQTLGQLRAKLIADFLSFDSPVNSKTDSKFNSDFTRGSDSKLDHKPSVAELDRLILNLIGQPAADPSFLILHEADPINSKTYRTALSQTYRLKTGEPIAYIIGFTEFYGRKFSVTPNVLIPRPESAVGIDLLKTYQPTKLLDVGTGSGALAITAALELPETSVGATDISRKALKIARQNANQFNVKIEFFACNLLKNPAVWRFLASTGKSVVKNTKTGVKNNRGRTEKHEVLAIIANLPYVDPCWDWLDHDRLKFEPPNALFAADRGLALIKRLLSQINTPNLLLLLEADPYQHETIITFAQKLNFQLVNNQDFWLVFRR